MNMSPPSGNRLLEGFAADPCNARPVMDSGAMDIPAQLL